jgi:hypothetical protein
VLALVKVTGYRKSIIRQRRRTQRPNVTAQCQHCGARLTRSMPDAWMGLDEEGKQEMVDADDPEYDAEGM